MQSIESGSSVMQVSIGVAMMLAVTGASQAVTSACKEYVDDLKVMVDVDQALRRHIDYRDLPTGKVDLSHAPRLFQQMDIGRPQPYGTQMKMDGSCAFELQPLDDRRKVNERRKAAGMPSLEEYEVMFKSYVESQGCPKPPP